MSLAVGIDASNLRDGGGRTHLIEILRHADRHLGAFTRVVVWGARSTLDLLPQRPWLDAQHEPLLDQALPARVLWQHVHLPRRMRSVDLLFAPGGLTTNRVRPRVVMSRNMLPFDARERARLGGPIRLRLELLRRLQARSFETADGVIFLNEWARREVTAALRAPPARLAVIPHGVSDRFRMAPREQRTGAGPLRLLYVSAVSPYKHQIEVVRAVARLRAEHDVSLTLIGPDDGSREVPRLERVLAEVDPGATFARYLGKVPFDQIHAAYRDCDVFVFASSCENMPNILMEAMSSGLPIACAHSGPMPELLGDAGTYFDPDRPDSIADAVRALIVDPARRAALAQRAHARAAQFRWDDCARDTFAFLQEVARR